MKRLMKYWKTVIPVIAIVIILSAVLFAATKNIVSLFIPLLFAVGSSAVFRIKNKVLSNVYCFFFLTVLGVSCYYLWMIIGPFILPQ